MKKIINAQTAFEKRFEEALAREGFTTTVTLSQARFGDQNSATVQFNPKITLRVADESPCPLDECGDILTRAAKRLGFLYGNPSRQGYTQGEEGGVYEISEAGFYSKHSYVVAIEREAAKHLAELGQIVKGDAE